MKEQFIKFIDKNMDGCGTDISITAKVYGYTITAETVSRVKKAINNYKNENESEWDSKGCRKAAQKQLEADGYEVSWIVEEIVIYF